MNQFMYLSPFFTVCEEILTTASAFIESYGFIAACCLLFVGAMLMVVDASLVFLNAMTQSWRIHKSELLPYYGQVKYRSALDLASRQKGDVYGNCPIRLSEIGLEIEMKFGTPLNWDYATMDLLVGTNKSKKKARQALLGDHWLTFVTAVPPAERTQLYKAAMGLQKAFDKLEADKLMEHQALVAPMGFAVTSVRWNRESQSWSFSYGCKVVKKSEV